MAEATVIDSLVVELGLDPSKLDAQQKRAVDAFKKAQEAGKKAGQEIEERAAKAAEGLEKIAKAAFGVFAAFTAGRGIRDFVEGMIEVNSELGRSAKNIDSNAQILSQWRGAATQVGGTAQATTASIAGLVGQFEMFSITGNSSVIPYFRALGVHISDAEGRMRPFNDIMLELADRFSHMDRARANVFGQQLGLDQGTINLLLQGRQAVQAMLEAQKRYAPTDKDIAAATKMQAELAKLQQASTRLGITLLTEATPAIDKVATLLNNLADWLQAHPTVLTAIAIGLGAIGTAITVGLSVSALSVAATGLATVTSAVASLGFTMLFTPFGWFLLSIAAIVYAFTHWRDIMKEVKSLWEDLTTKAGAQRRAASYAAQQRAIHDREHGIWHPISWYKDHDEKQAAVAKQVQNLSPRTKALLTDIAGGESGGQYNVMYGGSTFSSYADHPNIPHLITSGPNVGKYSTAAGKYQFTHETWKEAQKALGLKDFSPASQDKAAMWVAARDYLSRTGRDLNKDLQSNDPHTLAMIGRALAPTWTSLPGGIESSQSSQHFVSSLTGAPAAAMAASGGAGGQGGKRSITIGNISVDASNAKDAAETWQDTGKAIDNFDVALQANGGPA